MFYVMRMLVLLEPPLLLIEQSAWGGGLVISWYEVAGFVGNVIDDLYIGYLQVRITTCMRNIISVQNQY